MNWLRKDWQKWFALERSNFPIIGIALLLTLGAYFWRLYLLRVRWLGLDEFEHLHAAWAISKGLLPYRDFFEHHTPWMHFFLAPFYVFFDVETNSEAAIAFIFFVRMWMWIFAGGILVLTLRLGMLWRDMRVGSIAALFLSNTAMFLGRTLEVRPDVLSVCLWVTCLVTVVRAIREKEPSRKTLWQFAWSGVFLGSAVMCTQKMLFAFPGFALAMFWYITDPRSMGSHRERLRNIGCQIAGICLPIVLTLGYFVWRGGLHEFIEFNFLLNSRWKARFSPAYYLTQLVRQNPIPVLLAVVGFFRAFFGMFGRERFLRGEFVYVLNALGLFVGLFIMPVPWTQYYLMFLPLGAIFAAGILVDAADGIAGALQHGTWPKDALAYLYILPGLGAFIAALAFALRHAMALVFNHLPKLTAWGIAFALAASLVLLLRRKSITIAVLLIALSTQPFSEMRDPAGQKNTEVLNQIRYVIENTSPTETCMEGWTGGCVFRPHAWFYWFLHDEIRPMLSDERKNELLSGLRSGSIAPKLIFLDVDLKDLSKETTRFFEEAYEPMEVAPIWRRK